MQIITPQTMRKRAGHLIKQVSRRGAVIGVGTKSHIDVLIVKFPQYLNNKLTLITNINANSRSFDFLKDEPDLYSTNDLKVQYV